MAHRPARAGCLGRSREEFPIYASGSDGPPAADELITLGDGRSWRAIVRELQSAATA